ncbi:hypothetical protein HYFRA_00004976 [Hymenoscyphus fraxineus]|uniref:TM7S3/TM198-like domain-containing protein n=1 Tax=Hymenoscyphus fraxineus TaxID=746836 RepID=A0A9N9KNR2_9HELO|nr:hypothetical protein HYFRA_00004976 [Hymenoscyphus fraxineus]
MFFARGSSILTIILLCLYINLSVADRRVDRRGVHYRRQDGPTPPSITEAQPPAPNSLTPSASDTPTDTDARISEKSSSQSLRATTTSAAPTNSSPNTLLTSATATSGTAVADPTSSVNDTIYNSTLTPNKLPITPRITPGFGVAGVILIATGAVLTVVGIKNKRLHIFLSAAYLSSLSIVVLILYVMNLPVSDAIQGAYVVAATITGLIVGGASIVFTEMTEGLGALLGGFCLSMWLLVLKPGGLLTTTTSKSIFIGSFTAAGFSTSFSQYTRPYGLIVGSSFAGATVLVLGIDCFSQAGLKEFWAYIWALNENLFPVGATSYPMTKGIKVEIAAIVVLCIVGILSQIKLWKVIRERREQRALQRLADERSAEQEEKDVGNRIEILNNQERERWENVYGDRNQRSTGNSQRDSGVGDMESHRKGPTSMVTSSRRSGEDEIELSDMPSPTQQTRDSFGMTNRGQNGNQVMVRVARDPSPEPEFDANGIRIGTLGRRRSHGSMRDGESTDAFGSDSEARTEGRPSRRESRRSSNNPPVSVRVSRAPDVVPLPFKVPEGETEDDGSSVATFADEEQDGRRKSRFSKHISAGSAMIRRLSDRSLMSPSPRSSRRFSVNDGESVEELVIPHDVDDDRASSVAATIDGLSDSDDELRSIRSSINQVPDTSESAQVPTGVAGIEDGSASAVDVNTVDGNVPDQKATDTLKSVETLEAEGRGGAQMKSLTASTDPKMESGVDTNAVPTDIEQSGAITPKAAQSVVSTVDSRTKPRSLTAAQLPPPLSKVMMSYRTNEWAKHLSSAETPEVEDLKMDEPGVGEEPKQKEVSVPVNVEELQQTAENATPPPMPRKASNTPGKSSSSKHVASSYASLTEASPKTSFQEENPRRSMNKQRTSSNPVSPHALPTEGHYFPTSPNVPFGSTNTLMGQRESMVRNKSLYISQVSLLPKVPLHAHSKAPPQAHANFRNISAPVGSDSGSVYNGRHSISNPVVTDDDNMSLAARRDLIRQSSLGQISPPAVTLPRSPIPYDSHQPKRQSTVQSPGVREQQMASWRASVQQDLSSSYVPRQSIERQRNALWNERQADEQRKAMEAKMRGERDSAFDERMRRGDMLEAHRDALRRMQASANKNA